MTWYFETLTVRAWVLHIFPRLILERLRGRRITSSYVFDASPLAFYLASFTGRLLGTTVRRMQFRSIDAHDEDGTCIWLRVAYDDVAKLQQAVLHEPSVRDFATDHAKQSQFPFYLAKILAIENTNERYTLTRALLVIRYCAWMNTKNARHTDATLFLEHRPWLNHLQTFAARLGVVVRGLEKNRSFRDLLLSCVGLSSIAAIRFALSRRTPFKHDAYNPEPSIAVQYYGHLNLDQPELYSDLFFTDKSAVARHNLLMLFSLPRDPLREEMRDELFRHNVNAIALDPRSSNVRDIPAFVPEVRIFEDVRERLALHLGSSPVEQKWLRRQLLNYTDRRNYWRQLFERRNIKMHVTWYNVDGEHVAIADALRDVNGVSAIYQRSLEVVPDVEMAVAADVFFGFSHDSVETQSKSGSQIMYSVVTGYLGGHRFPILGVKAQELRAKLQKKGAESIVAFFDENSSVDERWQIGHSQPQESYKFLLEKVLTHPWFGLVLKPKVPGTLRTRLGPVAALLDRALQTGRCYVFEGGRLHSNYPAALAALASDVAIHDHLCSGTAAMEAALAGVPTLLLDREGFPMSPLYNLGVGRVVFNTWQDLWDTYLRHSRDRKRIERFGDWSPILDRLDPFRDGLAAHRMGEYLHWTFTGLKQGLGRETALADAAERYCHKWGHDKIRTEQLDTVSAAAKA